MALFCYVWWHVIIYPWSDHDLTINVFDTGFNWHTIYKVCVFSLLEYYRRGDVFPKVCLCISIICMHRPYALQPYRQLNFRGSVSDILSSYLLLPMIYFVSQLICTNVWGSVELWDLSRRYVDVSFG